MKNIMVLVFVFFLGILVVSCAVGAPTPTNPGSVLKDSKPVSLERGNNAYLPINLPGLPEHNIDEILIAIENWETSHPNLVVDDTETYYMQNTYSLTTSNFTYGVRIHFHKK